MTLILWAEETSGAQRGQTKWSGSGKEAGPSAWITDQASVEPRHVSAAFKGAPG